MSVTFELFKLHALLRVELTLSDSLCHNQVGCLGNVICLA